MSKGKNGAPARGSLGRNRMLRFRAWKGFYGRKRNILLRGWLPWPVRAHRRVACGLWNQLGRCHGLGSRRSKGNTDKSGQPLHKLRFFVCDPQ